MVYLWFMFQYDKCLECFEKSLKVNALQVPVWFNLWFMFQYDKCLECFEKSLKVNALQVPVWFTSGLCFSMINV